MTEQSLFWDRVSTDLGIEIITPFEVTFPDGSHIKASALVKNFGAKHGMVVDADYAIIKPHTSNLIECGYGYSAILGWSPDEYERDYLIEVLTDWGWSGAPDKKPAWLR